MQTGNVSDLLEFICGAVFIFSLDKQTADL